MAALRRARRAQHGRDSVSDLALSSAGTFALQQITAHAHAVGPKVLLVGDHAQLQSRW